MPTFYGLQMNKVLNSPLQSLIEVAHVGGRVRCFNEKITLASQAIADIVYVARLPKNAVPLFGVIHSSVTLGATTFSVGVTGTVAKYRALAVFTTPDIPVIYGLVAPFGEMLTVQEDWFLTIAALAFPAAGTLRHQVYYTLD